MVGRRSNIGPEVQGARFVVGKIKANPIVVAYIVMQQLTNFLEFFLQSAVAILGNLGYFWSEVFEHCFLANVRIR